MKSRIVLLAAALWMAASAAAQSQPQTRALLNAVTVEADGRIEAAPDLAELTFEVAVTEKELRRAYERATTSLQQIVALAERNSIARDDVTTGRLQVQPITDYDDRKQRTRAYRVRTVVVFRLRDFARIAPLVDDAVGSGVADFRSVNYLLTNEEAAKQQAVSAAMRSAMARARAAVGENGQKLGALQSVTVDVSQPLAIVEGDALPELAQSNSALFGFRKERVAPPPMPNVAPDKIAITAKVHCIFRID